MKVKLCLLFLLPFTTLLSQKLAFDIFLFGNKIGQTVLERITKNDSVITYTLNSASEAHIFFTTRKFTLNYNVVYKNNQLFSSYAKSTRNSEVNITTIQWQNNSFLMLADNVSSCIKPPIDCSTVKLFFEEPCNHRKTFSERMGIYRAIKKTGEGVYECEMSEGLTYIYRYKNGRLTELEMRKGFLGSVYLRPAKQ